MEQYMIQRFAFDRWLDTWFKNSPELSITDPLMKDSLENHFLQLRRFPLEYMNLQEAEKMFSYATTKFPHQEYRLIKIEVIKESQQGA